MEQIKSKITIHDEVQALSQKYESILNKEQFFAFLSDVDNLSRQRIINRDLPFLTHFIRSNETFNESNVIKNKQKIKEYFFEINSIGKMDFANLKMLLGSSQEEITKYIKTLTELQFTVNELGGNPEDESGEIDQKTINYFNDEIEKPQEYESEELSVALIDETCPIKSPYEYTNYIENNKNKERLNETIPVETQLQTGQSKGI